MKINVFAREFVKTVNDGLRLNGELSTLRPEAQTKLQNLIIVLGNSLIGDVTSQNAPILQQKLTERIKDCPIDGFLEKHIDWGFKQLQSKLEKTQTHHKVEKSPKSPE